MLVECEPIFCNQFFCVNENDCLFSVGCWNNIFPSTSQRGMKARFER